SDAKSHRLSPFPSFLCGSSVSSSSEETANTTYYLLSQLQWRSSHPSPQAGGPGPQPAGPGRGLGQMSERIRAEHRPLSVVFYLVISPRSSLHVNRWDKRNIINLLEHCQDHGVG